MTRFGPKSPKNASGSSKADNCLFQLVRKPGRPTIAGAEQLADHILTAGWGLLLDEGFERFSFDRLARRARVGKPTIYARFANKRAFLEALVIHRTDNKREAVIALGGGGDFAETLIKQTTHAMTSILSPEGRLLERLMDWLDEEKGGAGNSVRQMIYLGGLAKIREQFAAAQTRGEIVFHDVDRAARLWIEAMVGHARLKAADENLSASDHEAWSRDYTAFFLKGIGAKVDQNSSTR
nr:TetR/AcrR family transcriptional regulator [uncultured Sphingomonas sp.]